MERLKALLRIDSRGQSVVQDCIVDTGATITIFPEKEWKRFASRIVWLRAANNAPLAPWLTSVSGMTGGSVPCNPGLVSVQIMDVSGNSLSPKTIIALFARDGGQLKNILLGLDGNFLAACRFKVHYDRQGAWLCQI
jgi:hypothetical protein